VPGIRCAEVWNRDWPRVLHDKQLTGFSPLALRMSQAPVVRSTVEVGGALTWVCEDDLVHFVLEAVEAGSLSRFVVNYRGSGSEQCPPRMLLALLIYCYARCVFDCPSPRRPRRPQTEGQGTPSGRRPGSMA